MHQTVPSPSAEMVRRGKVDGRGKIERDDEEDGMGGDGRGREMQRVDEVGQREMEVVWGRRG